MEASVIRDKVFEEIKLIPEHKLTDVYDFIHYFRPGLQNAKADVDEIMHLAGSWQDMPDEVFNEFLGDIAQRRNHAPGAC